MLFEVYFNSHVKKKKKIKSERDLYSVLDSLYMIVIVFINVIIVDSIFLK